MQTVQTSTGPVDVRALTARQIRNGKEHGLRYFGLPDLEANFEGARDYCIGCLMGDDAVDTIPNADQNVIFSAILLETWGDPAAEKNLPTSGPSAQTETE